MADLFEEYLRQQLAAGGMPSQDFASFTLPEPPEAETTEPAIPEPIPSPERGEDAISKALKPLRPLLTPVQAAVRLGGAATGKIAGEFLPEAYERAKAANTTGRDDIGQGIAEAPGVGQTVMEAILPGERGPWGNVAKTLAGLGGDIVTDPISYIGSAPRAAEGTLDAAGNPVVWSKTERFLQGLEAAGGLKKAGATAARSLSGPVASAAYLPDVAHGVYQGASQGLEALGQGDMNQAAASAVQTGTMGYLGYHQARSLHSAIQAQRIRDSILNPKVEDVVGQVETTQQAPEAPPMGPEMFPNLDEDHSNDNLGQEAAMRNEGGMQRQGTEIPLRPMEEAMAQQEPLTFGFEDLRQMAPDAPYDEAGAQAAMESEGGGQVPGEPVQQQIDRLKRELPNETLPLGPNLDQPQGAAQPLEQQFQQQPSQQFTPDQLAAMGGEAPPSTELQGPTRTIENQYDQHPGADFGMDRLAMMGGEAEPVAPEAPPPTPVAPVAEPTTDLQGQLQDSLGNPNEPLPLQWDHPRALRIAKNLAGSFFNRFRRIGADKNEMDSTANLAIGEAIAKYKEQGLNPQQVPFEGYLVNFIQNKLKALTTKKGGLQGKAEKNPQLTETTKVPTGTRRGTTAGGVDLPSGTEKLVGQEKAIYNKELLGKVKELMGKRDETDNRIYKEILQAPEKRGESTFEGEKVTEQGVETRGEARERLAKELGVTRQAISKRENALMREIAKLHGIEVGKDISKVRGKNPNEIKDWKTLVDKDEPTPEDYGTVIDKLEDTNSRKQLVSLGEAFNQGLKDKLDLSPKRSTAYIANKMREVLGLEKKSPKASVGDNLREGGDLVTHEHVRDAFPGAEITAHPSGGWSVDLPNGKTIRIRVEKDGVSINRLSDAQYNQMHPDKGGRLLGEWLHLPVGGIISLAKEGAGAGTLNHEILHMAMSMSLNAKERAQVIEHFLGEAKKRLGAEWEESPANRRNGVAEEAAADWYSKSKLEWGPVRQVFDKIQRFFGRMLNGFRPTWRDSMAKIRSGEAFETATNQPRPVVAKANTAFVEESDRVVAAGAFAKRQQQARNLEAKGEDIDVLTNLHDRETREKPIASIPSPTARQRRAAKHAGVELVEEKINTEKYTGLTQDDKDRIITVAKTLREKGKLEGSFPHTLKKLEAEVGALRNNYDPLDFIEKVLRQGGSKDAAEDTRVREIFHDGAVKARESEALFHDALLDGNPDTIERAALDMTRDRNMLSLLVGAVADDGSRVARMLAFRKHAIVEGTPGLRAWDKLAQSLKAQDYTAAQQKELKNVWERVVAGREHPQAFFSMLEAGPKVGLMGKLLYLWKAGLLAPTGLVANMTSNTAMTVFRGIEDDVKAGLSKMFLKKEDREHLALPYALRSAMWKAALQGNEMDRGGIAKLLGDFKNILAAKPLEKDIYHPSELEDLRRFRKPFGKGKGSEFIDSGFKVLDSGDQFFKTISMYRSLFKHAYLDSAKRGLSGKEAIAHTKNLVSEIMEARDYESANYKKHTKLWDKIVDEAERDTFQSALNPAHDKALWGEGIARSYSKAVADHPILSFLLTPFVKTPANIALETVRRTPLGFLKAVQNYSKSGDKNRLMSDLAAPLVGTATMGLVLAAAREGFMTGGGPTDPEKEALLKETGWQPYSVKVGDKYYQYNRLEPISAIIGIAADIAEAEKKGEFKTTGQKMDKLFGSIGENLTNKTFLAGLEGFFSMWHDPKRYAERWAKQTVGSLVPNSIGFVPFGSLAKALDPVYRKTSLEDNPISVVQNKIPGLSKQLPAQLTPTGEERERPGSGFIGRLLSPVAVSKEVTGKESMVARELARIDYPPSIPRSYMTPGGVKVQLTRDEQATLLAAHKAATKALERVIKDPTYQALPDNPEDPDFKFGMKSKKDVVARIYNKYRQQAQDRIKRAVYSRAARA